MNRFGHEIGEIYRLKVPFENIYTSVFLVYTSEGVILVDCATTAEDVEACILPALSDRGLKLSDIGRIVITHPHSDHAGGLSRILALAPAIRVVRAACRLADGVETYALPGHTEDHIGLLDARSRTLISGDGLQGAGVDRYRCSVPHVDAYLATLEKIKNDERIENILFSHAYEPWLSDRALGRATVMDCVAQCPQYVHKAIV